MSAKPKPQSTEIDHIRDTLTGVINVVGETRSDVKILDRKVEILDHKIDAYQQDNRDRFDQIEQKFDAYQQENRDRFDQQDKKIAGLEADNAEIKEMLKALLSR